MSGIADFRGRHPLATGLFAGAAVGVGLGLLFAPRRGSETRKGVGNGYRRAKGTVGQWANRGRGMYATTREKVTKGARGTAGYVRDVADAVRMKNRPPSSGHPRKVV